MTLTYLGPQIGDRDLIVPGPAADGGSGLDPGFDPLVVDWDHLWLASGNGFSDEDPLTAWPAAIGDLNFGPASGGPDPEVPTFSAAAAELNGHAGIRMAAPETGEVRFWSEERGTPMAPPYSLVVIAQSGYSESEPFARLAYQDSLINPYGMSLFRFDFGDDNISPAACAPGNFAGGTALGAVAVDPDPAQLWVAYVGADGTGGCEIGVSGESLAEYTPGWLVDSWEQVIIRAPGQGQDTVFGLVGICAGDVREDPGWGDFLTGAATYYGLTFG